MIDFRYHVVSIVAVFLALALGLFLGSTTLQGRVFDDLKGRTDSVTKKNAQLSSQLHAAQARIGLDQNFDKALLPYAVSGRLSGQLVTLVSAPGANDGVRKQLISTLQAAGATVTMDVRIQDSFVDPKQDAFLTSLASHVNVPGDAPASGSTGVARAVSQIAAVLGERPNGHSVPAGTIDTVLSTYSAAKMLSVGKTTATHAGTLAVVLAGPAPAATADATQVSAQYNLVLDLVRDLDASALGAVLAAPSTPPDSGPDIVAAAGNDGSLTRAASTVSGVDTAAGQIATVFALAGQADGIAGQFGASASTPLPSPSAAP